MFGMLVFVSLAAATPVQPVYTAPETVITAKAPDCSFAFRSLVQGTGTVRGFCGTVSK